MEKRLFPVIILLLFSTIANTQTLGGSSAFNFINQPNSAQLSALGGVNISSIGNDVALSFHNPALLRNEMHQQLNASFNDFVAGIKNYSLNTGFHLPKINANLGFGVNYFNYGTIPQTDAIGNISGTFRPTDYVVQVMASKQYKERFWLGSTLKFVNSSYGQFKSNAVAIDIGVSYFDTANRLQISVLVKNIGTQLKTYNNSDQKEELPFDIQFGITKRLSKAPIQLSLTAQHLQQFAINYNDSIFNVSEGIENANTSSLDKIASHLILASQFFLGDKLELSAAYNFSRRKDLNAYNVTNGLNGFTMGIGLKLKNLQIRYGTGFYQQNKFHQVSLNINWKGVSL